MKICESVNSETNFKAEIKKFAPLLLCLSRFVSLTVGNFIYKDLSFTDFSEGDIVGYMTDGW